MPSGPLGTPSLTDFDGPDETPLSENGNWTQTLDIRAPMRRLNNVATDSIHGDPNYSHWVKPVLIPTGQRGEVFACTEGGQLGAALETWRVFLWTVVGADAVGYLMYFGGGLSKDTVIRRYDSIGSFPTIASEGFGGYPSKMALVIDGDQVQAWSTYGAGDWVLNCEVTDLTYRGVFYAGIGIEDPTSGGAGSLSINCFGAGRPNRTQFFRWLYN